jgi:hypothetical protein
MSSRALFSLGVSLTVLCTGLLANPLATTAEPAPVFKPLIKDIRSQLPRGMKMRLPSSTPRFPVKLYPYIKSDREGFKVNLARTPNCAKSNAASACTVGSFAAFKPGALKVWPPTGQSVTTVNLSNGIQGFYVIRGSGINSSKNLFWKQDSSVFGLGVGAGASQSVTQQQLVETANSMIKEPAITGTR